MIYKREVKANIKKVLSVSDFIEALDSYLINLEDGTQVKIHPDLFATGVEVDDYYVEEGRNAFFITEDSLKKNYIKIEV